MTPTPAVRCEDCGFRWNSTTMAEGLRVLGSCPRCAGRLHFRDEHTDHDRDHHAPAAKGALEPHLVLGLPRRDSGLS